MTPYTPGTPVWLAPDPDGDVFSVCPALVVKWVDWARLYEVATDGGGRQSVGVDEVFATEADAIEDRKQAAAKVINAARERIAAAEQFLGRPGV